MGREEKRQFYKLDVEERGKESIEQHLTPRPVPWLRVGEIEICKEIREKGTKEIYGWKEGMKIRVVS
jgi:hypothetical protein